MASGHARRIGDHRAVSTERPPTPTTPGAVAGAGPDPDAPTGPPPAVAPADVTDPGDPGDVEAAGARAQLARSSALMASGTLVSRLLGFVRTFVQLIALGGTFQVGAQVFDVANKLPNIFYMLLAGGVLNAVLVPQIVRALRRPDGGKEFVDRLITLSVLLVGAATLLLTLAAPLVVRLYTDDWSDEWLALATLMAFWCLPQVFFYGLYTVLGQVLNARGSFGPYMWAPVLNNVVAIAGLGAFMLLAPGARDLPATDWTPAMIAVLAGTSTLGIVAQALVLFWPLHRSGYRWRPRLGFRGVGFRTAGRVALWTFAGVAAGQLVFVLTSRTMTSAGDEIAAADVNAATNASYTVAYLLFMLPHSLVAVSLVTALFTRLSDAAAQGRVDAVRRDFSYGARTVAVAGALATTAFVALGPWIGAAMVREGRPVGDVLVAMGLGLVPFSVNYLVARVFYAYEDARTAFVVSLVTALVMAAGNVVCLLLLPAELTVVGIGAAMTVSNVVALTLSLTLLRRHLRRLDGGGVGARLLLRTVVRVTIIGLVSGGLVRAGVEAFAPATVSQGVNVVVVVVAGTVLLALYVALCRLMRVHELRDLAAPLLRRLPLPGRR